MIDVTNGDRAAWAETAVEAFVSVCRMDGEDLETKSKDLVTDICHLLRLNCGLSEEQVEGILSNAFAMFETEVLEDSDNGVEDQADEQDE